MTTEGVRAKQKEILKSVIEMSEGIGNYRHANIGAEGQELADYEENLASMKYLRDVGKQEIINITVELSRRGRE